LKFLRITYGLADNVYPWTFNTLWNNRSSWPVLEWIHITYLFQDPNWEMESVSQLAERLCVKWGADTSRDLTHSFDSVRGNISTSYGQLRIEILEGGAEIED
jgi:hypothetical protein